jgi:hypothetical protein
MSPEFWVLSKVNDALETTGEHETERPAGDIQRQEKISGIGKEDQPWSFFSKDYTI